MKLRLDVMALVGLLTGCHGQEDSLFGGLGSVVTKLGDYINSATPYIKEGLQMAQRAEQWVDSVIAEECIYSCPSSSK